MIKLKNGGQLFSDTAMAIPRPRDDCAAANRETNDFIWTEMQHSPAPGMTWTLMWGPARMPMPCPASASPNENEMDEQHATDRGALVLVIPTVRTLEEAQLGAHWAFFRTGRVTARWVRTSRANTGTRWPAAPTARPSTTILCWSK